MVIDVRESANKARVRQLRWNLVLLGLYGVAVCSWFEHYTDWLTTVLGVLTLGGVLSWLGTIFKVIPEDRWKEIKSFIESEVLLSPRYRIALAAVTVASAIVVSLVGSIEVESHETNKDRTVTVSPANLSKSHVKKLPAHNNIRTPVRVWPWWKQTPVRVKVEGYPAIMRRVVPFSRVDLLVPEDFIRPVIHLRPSRFLMSLALDRTLNNQFTVELLRPSISPQVCHFTGRAVLIGSDLVEIQGPVRDAWAKELEVQKAPEDIQYWTSAEACFPDVALKDGETVVVVVKYPDGGIYSRTSISCHAGQSADDLVQYFEISDPGL